ncbi:hypothetical protein Glove_478g71 [Diversispora epigaea]|uniref:TLDc domain-containing protein n=1 Tax=Diversispora epigaea TaxID=1348612 RepID=A0A397GTS9_9GLOM|nr:hypothetical protein Glove_478g71 [Diversispora epigaea]
MTFHFNNRLSNELLEIGKEEVFLANIYKVHSIILQSRRPYFKKKFDEITFNENHVKIYLYEKFSLKKLENSVIFDLLIASNELELEESPISSSKNPTLPTNLSEWTSVHFSSLKETLKGCLPHIRFFSFSNVDVVEKIYQYRQLLEQQLFFDINSKFITPNKPISSITTPIPLNTTLPNKITQIPLNTTLPNKITQIPLSSNIITNKRALEISSWIDEKEIPYIKNSPYEFELLVGGSRDGFDIKTIFNICDKVSKTIVILKVEGTGEILGGYHPLKWNKNKNQSMATKCGFVFSLKTANLKNSILSRAESKSSTINSSPNNLELSFGRVLYLKGNLKTEKECYCMQSNEHTKPILPSEFISSWTYTSKKSLFSVEEYEVFKISPRM